MKFTVVDGGDKSHAVQADVLIIHSSGVHEFVNGEVKNPEFVASFSSPRSVIRE